MGIGTFFVKIPLKIGRKSEIRIPKYETISKH